MSFIYLKSSLITRMVYLDPTHCDQLPVGLLAQMVEHGAGITEAKGFKSRTGLNFFSDPIFNY